MFELKLARHNFKSNITTKIGNVFCRYRKVSKLTVAFSFPPCGKDNSFRKKLAFRENVESNFSENIL